MKRLACIAALLALAGCTAVDNAVDTVSAPPSDVLTHIQALFEWLGSLFGPFFLDLFNAIFGE